MLKRGVIGNALLALVAGGAVARVQAQAPVPAAGRKRFLVHVTTGPQDPTRVALSFLVAATALRQATR